MVPSYVLGKAKIADTPYRQLPGSRELINSYLYLDLQKWQISRKRGRAWRNAQETLQTQFDL
jgi:hypothetical protein